MRTTIPHFMERTATFEQLQKELKFLLNEPPKFKFNFADVVQYEEEENILSCSAIEQTEDNEFQITVTYPDIFSEEPIVGGETLLKICISEQALIDYNQPLFDPTWKQLLLAINNTLTENNLCNLVLYSIEIIGLTANGMGYILEAVMVDPSREM